jgi:hypothetical protein
VRKAALDNELLAEDVHLADMRHTHEMSDHVRMAYAALLAKGLVDKGFQQGVALV